MASRKSKTPTAPEAAPAETVAAAEAAPAKKSRSKKKVEAAPVEVAPVDVVEAVEVIVVSEPEPIAAVAVDAEPAPFVATREQIARRAYHLFLRDGGDAFANWMRAEREVTQVARRARELWMQGSNDTLGNWFRAEAEI